jgi:signal transduction histidine kinase/CheY-like chemotaxis protein
VSNVPAPIDERILILAPLGRDAELTAAALSTAGLRPVVCADIEDLCHRLEEGAGAAVMTEEALTRYAMSCLNDALKKQPPWSDFPLLIFSSQPSAESVVASFEQIARANVTLIERPVAIKTMISATRAALRARRRQYEVQELLAQLQRRIEERDQFLAMLSHELRNPLAAILLAVEGLDTHEAPELANEHAIIVRQTRHLAKLVDDLLDIARVTTGKISIDRTQVDLVDIVEHCVESLRARIEARRMNVSVHRKAPHVMLLGDPVRLEQVANNLLSNALKYTPPGGDIDVAIDIDDGDAVLRVRDSGKGIPPDMLTRVFDLFMQGETTIDRSEGGMGIGLTLVQKLVELHGGSVRAYSRGRGSGSEFVVRLPRITSDAPVRARKPVDGEATARHILVVEDNPDIRDLLRMKLKHLGHRVETADDGMHGLELLLSSKPEIALIDIGLPGLDGYELARRIRAQIGGEVYLVALTGYGQAEDKQRALEAGFNVHLTKPADLVDLQNVIARVPARAAV